MNNNYGHDLGDLKDKKQKCIEMAASYLNQGCLGLMLGAGASRSMELPSWPTLVEKCAAHKLLGTKISSSIDTSELKRISENVKRACSSQQEYLHLVKDCLYEGVSFDFSLAKKDLLIALTALLVGKSRGNVQNIITYNFDSVLEWYLQTNGLKINVTTKENLFQSTVDVDITHLHGYLPHDRKFGNLSEFIVFTKEEFEDRQIQYDYFKDLLNEFFRKHIFLTIGISPDSLIDDICPNLRNLDKWYSQEKLLRGQPYGIALVPPAEVTDDVKDNLVRHGIIPCTLDKEQVPPLIFEIAQAALAV